MEIRGHVLLSTVSNQQSYTARWEYSYQRLAYFLGPTQQAKKDNKVKRFFFSLTPELHRGSVVFLSSEFSLLKPLLFPRGHNREQQGQSGHLHDRPCCCQSVALGCFFLSFFLRKIRFSFFLSSLCQVTVRSHHLCKLGDRMGSWRCSSVSGSCPDRFS